MPMLLRPLRFLLLPESTTPGWSCPGDPRKAPQPLGPEQEPWPHQGAEPAACPCRDPPSLASQRLWEHPPFPSVGSSVCPWQGPPSTARPCWAVPSSQRPGTPLHHYFKPNRLKGSETDFSGSFHALGKGFLADFSFPKQFVVCFLR